MDEPELESDPEIDAVLADLIGQLGARFSLVGRGTGAAWSARRLKTETAHQIIDFDPNQSDRAVHALTEMLGTRPETDPESGETHFRGVVGAGFGNLNPAYVLAVVAPAKGGIGVAAYAKEGLIKQHTARKAVVKVAKAITEAGVGSR